MTKHVFRTEQKALEYALSLPDSRVDPETNSVWARDPETRALGRCYITPCVAVTSKGKRVAAFALTFGA